MGCLLNKNKNEQAEAVLEQNSQVEMEPVLLHKGSQAETHVEPRDNYNNNNNNNNNKQEEDEEDENKRLKMRLLLIQNLLLLKSEVSPERVTTK
jgi:hypothetical protein